MELNKRVASRLAKKNREKRYKSEIRRIAMHLGYRIVSFTIGKSEEDTMVTFINTRLSEHTTTLRAFKQREKVGFSIGERYAICEMYERLGYRNFFKYPNDMEQWCKSLCDCLGYEFVSIEESRFKSETRVIYKGGSNLVTSMQDKLYRRGRRMIKDGSYENK